MDFLQMVGLKAILKAHNQYLDEFLEGMTKPPVQIDTFQAHEIQNIIDDNLRIISCIGELP